MKPIPKTEQALVLRTDFSNQAAWEEICAELQKPAGPMNFYAYVHFLDDAEFADLTKDQLLQRIPQDYNHSFIMVVDRAAIAQPEHPLQVIELFWRPGKEFRAIPSAIQEIENNLSIANMDFEEFAGAVEDDGVFRGFPYE